MNSFRKNSPGLTKISHKYSTSHQWEEEKNILNDNDQKKIFAPKSSKSGYRASISSINTKSFNFKNIETQENSIVPAVSYFNESKTQTIEIKDKSCSSLVNKLSNIESIYQKKIDILIKENQRVFGEIQKLKKGVILREEYDNIYNKYRETLKDIDQTRKNYKQKDIEISGIENNYGKLVYLVNKFIEGEYSSL